MTNIIQSLYRIHYLDAMIKSQQFGSKIFSSLKPQRLIDINKEFLPNLFAVLHLQKFSPTFLFLSDNLFSSDK